MTKLSVQLEESFQEAHHTKWNLKLFFCPIECDEAQMQRIWLSKPYKAYHNPAVIDLYQKATTKHLYANAPKQNIGQLFTFLKNKNKKTQHIFAF